jgi:hypothetical protein
MTLTRTRLILIGIVGALVILGAACAGGLGDGGESKPSEENGPPTGSELQSSRDTLDNQLDADEGAAPSVPADGEAALASTAGTGGLGEAPAEDPKLQGLLDRKIIQSTSVDIEVTEVARNFQEIIRIAETAGGFVASSTFSNVDDEQVADITIRVPGDSYQDVLAQIRGMGEVAQESSDANDVTEEYTDLQARLRTLEATEQRYLELLGQADEINEILQVQDRLDSVRGQIEQVQGRINLLEHLTDLATITVHLRPETAAVAATVSGGGVKPLDAASAAWDTSLEALRGLAAAVLVVGVFSWWLVPPLAALGMGARWWLGRRTHPASESAA